MRKTNVCEIQIRNENRSEEKGGEKDREKYQEREYLRDGRSLSLSLTPCWASARLGAALFVAGEQKKGVGWP